MVLSHPRKEDRKLDDALEFAVILDVPYVYRATITRGKKRASETALYGGSILVEAPEVAGIEAPVALRYDIEDRAQGAKGREGIVELRWFQDRLFRLHPMISTNGRNRDGFVDAFTKIVEDNSCAQSPFFRGEDRKGRLPPRSEDLDVKEFLGSDEEQMITEIRSRARNIVIIDGKIWSAAREPLLRVDPLDGFRHRRVELFNGGSDHGDIFRFDEISMVEILYAKPFDSNCVKVVVPYHEVLIPECQRAKTTERAVLDAASHLHGRMREHIAEADEAYSTIYRQFRDALKPFRSPAWDGRSFVMPTDTDDDSGHDIGVVASHLETALETHLSAVPMDIWIENLVRKAAKRWELFLLLKEDQLDFSP